MALAPRLWEAAHSGKGWLLFIRSLFSCCDTQRHGAGKSVCGSQRDPAEPPRSDYCSSPSRSLDTGPHEPNEKAMKNGANQLSHVRPAATATNSTFC